MAEEGPMLGGDLVKILPADHRRALMAAIHVLIDNCLDDLVALQHGGAFTESTMLDHLPPTGLRHYDVLFAKRFLACVYTVAWKLQSPDQQALACVGEELALHALIQSAAATLDDNGAEADFSALYEAAFEDEDYALLFDPQWDGIEDTDRGQMLGMANLRPGDWFEPFRDEDPVHPYNSSRSATMRRKRRADLD